jgi:hypothetical protein
MSIQSLETIISRHDPENDVIPGMDLRVSWAEAELADTIKTLLARIVELENKVEWIQDNHAPGYYKANR